MSSEREAVRGEVGGVQPPILLVWWLWIQRWFSPTRRLVLSSFIGGLYFHIPIYSLFLVGKGVPLSVVLTSQVAFSLASCLGEIPTGVLADRIGQKLSVMIGIVLELSGFLLLILAPSTEMLFFVCVIRGLGDSFNSGAYDAWSFEVARHAGQSYSTLASRERILSASGRMISAAVTGVVVEMFGASIFPWLFVGTVFSLILCAALLWRVPEYRVPKSEASPSLWQGVIVPTWGLLKGNKTLRALMIVILFSLTGEYFLNAVNQPLFMQREVSPIWLGLSLSLGALLSMVMTAFLVRLNRAVSFITIQTCVTLVLGALFIVFGFSTDPIVSVVAFIAIKGLFSTTEPLLAEYIHREVDSAIRSTTLSAISCVRTGAQVVMRLVLGALVGLFSPVVAVIFFGVYLLIGALVGRMVLRGCGCTE